MQAEALRKKLEILRQREAHLKEALEQLPETPQAPLSAGRTAAPQRAGAPQLRDMSSGTTSRRADKPPQQAEAPHEVRVQRRQEPRHGGQ